MQVHGCLIVVEVVVKAACSPRWTCFSKPEWRSVVEPGAAEVCRGRAIRGLTQCSSMGTRPGWEAECWQTGSAAQVGRI